MLLAIQTPRTSMATMSSSPAPSPGPTTLSCRSPPAMNMPSSSTSASHQRPISFVLTRPSGSPSSPISPSIAAADNEAYRIPSYPSTSGSSSSPPRRSSLQPQASPSSVFTPEQASLTMNQLASYRPSGSVAGPSQTRSAQLALLAEQAKLASVGTSSIRVANATSAVMQQAVQQVVDTAGDSQAVGPSALVPARPSRHNLPGPTLATHAAAQDPAWEETFSSPDFLSSASSLAHLFEAQEQSRKEWAGQALALQHRRWTMTAHVVKKPKFFLPLPAPTKGKRTATQQDPDGDDTPTASSFAEASSSQTPPATSSDKRRRLSHDDDIDQQQSSPSSSQPREERRVSFAQDVAPPASFTPSSPSKAPKQDLRGILAPPRSRQKERHSASASASFSYPSQASGASSRPQLLANVIASFATLLDTRQQACAGLAELAKSGDEMGMSSSAPSRASSPPAAASEAIVDQSDEESDDDDSMSDCSSEGSGMDIREISREEDPLVAALRDGEVEQEPTPAPVPAGAGADDADEAASAPMPVETTVAAATAAATIAVQATATALTVAANNLAATSSVDGTTAGPAPGTTATATATPLADVVSAERVTAEGGEPAAVPSAIA